MVYDPKSLRAPPTGPLGHEREEQPVTSQEAGFRHEIGGEVEHRGEV
jgi:hypothetical protein